jgi:phage-related baseplate assembly protein
MTYPAFVDRSPDAVLAECKAQLEDLLGRELQPAGIEQLILQFVAYREVLLLNRFNAAMSQLLVKFSTAPVLDYLAELVAVERLAGDYAACSVRFTFVNPHPQTIIPAGTRVSYGSFIFATIEERIVEISETCAVVEMAAQELGSAANGIPEGKLTTILDPIAFVSKAENITPTSGGADVETDEQLRERIRLAPSQYSTAGSKQSYEFHAESASPLILDLVVYTEVPGTVRIAVLLDNPAADFPAVAERIRETCNADTVRPLTDTLVVEQAEAQEYSINVNITLLPRTDSAPALQAITAALQAYAENRRKEMGQDVTLAQINKACMISGVYDVQIVSPAAPIVVASNEYAKCTGINVNIVGFNE